MSVDLKILGFKKGSISEKKTESARDRIRIDADRIDIEGAQDTAKSDLRADAIAIGPEMSEHSDFLSAEIVRDSANRWRQVRIKHRNQCGSFSSNSLRRLMTWSPFSVDGS